MPPNLSATPQNPVPNPILGSQRAYNLESNSIFVQLDPQQTMKLHFIRLSNTTYHNPRYLASDLQRSPDPWSSPSWLCLHSTDGGWCRWKFSHVEFFAGNAIPATADLCELLPAPPRA